MTHPTPQPYPGLVVRDNVLFQRRLNGMSEDDAWLQEINAVLNSPATRAVFAKQGANPVIATPELIAIRMFSFGPSCLAFMSARTRRIASAACTAFQGCSG